MLSCARYKGVAYAFKMKCTLSSARTESLMRDNAYLQVKGSSLTVYLIKYMINALVLQQAHTVGDNMLS